VSGQTLNPTNPEQLLSNNKDSDYLGHLDKKIFRWHDKTQYIMVYIENGTGIRSWQPYYEELLHQAFQEWEDALNQTPSQNQNQNHYRRIHFIYMPDTRGSDVIVRWTQQAEKRKAHTDESGKNELMTWGKYIQKNDINLALESSEGRPYTPAEIQSTALHEAGHMLGIRGHSDDPSDIMFPVMMENNTEFPRHLSQRDINTIQIIYQKKADYTNPESVHLSNFDAFKKKHRGGGFSIMWISISGIPIPLPLPF
jgi:predicted Zn-dependent protease